MLLFGKKKNLLCARLVIIYIGVHLQVERYAIFRSFKSCFYILNGLFFLGKRSIMEVNRRRGAGIYGYSGAMAGDL